MSIPTSEVKNIARLARLSVSNSDLQRYSDELSQILELFDALSAVDTDGVEPMAHPLDVTLRLRADEVTEPDQRSKFQSVAPQVENGLYLVPRVID
ncbi:MAG: Asp-tRNA(Asn)/Glu-tRNA(Gln) amidotransferase subunit GatC [Gammaproteobacteria bacterium]|nr:Asp-tRNA(Asn)/Glu-tRNA(Gln) amidotransferase subunit GatC [Gammaproteobacteria bacterium]